MESQKDSFKYNYTLFFVSFSPFTWFSCEDDKNRIIFSVLQSVQLGVAINLSDLQKKVWIKRNGCIIKMNQRVITALRCRYLRWWQAL